MEIPKEIINSAFKAMRSSRPDEATAAILSELSVFSFEELWAFREDNKKLRAISYNLHTICQPAYHNSTVLATILSAATPYLSSFYSEADVKPLVIFIYVNSYLGVPYQALKNALSINRITKKAVEAVIKVVGPISLNISIKHDSRYFESELVRQYHEGLTENNLKKVYNFVIAVERGRGFRANFLAEKLLIFLCDINISAFVRQLNGLTATADAVFYLQGLSASKLVLIMKNRILTKGWVIFECMRQLTSNRRTGQFIKSAGNQAMIKSLNQLYASNRDLYKQAVDFMHTDSLFNQALGCQLEILSEEDIIQLFEQWLPLTEYSNQLEVRDLLLESLINNLDAETFNLVLETIYRRWLKQFEAILEDKEKYLKALFRTDYANFVIYYYTAADDEIILKLMTELLEKLIWIDCDWYENESSQIKGFNMLFSHLYLLSYAYDNKKLTDAVVHELINLFIGNVGFNKRFTGENYIADLATIRHNIGC